MADIGDQMAYVETAGGRAEFASRTNHDPPRTPPPVAINVGDYLDPIATRLLNAMLGNSNVDPLTLTSEAATTLVARAQGMARLLKEA